MSTIYLLQYNNYYNRIVKHEDSLEAYLSAATKSSSKTNINFVINDGLNTTQVVNWTETWTPDYLLAVDDNTTTKWFIIEWEQIRGKQFKATLRRDIVAENYNLILEAPMFIEKATVPTSNPLIFNSENMTFNQIKSDEVLINDRSGTPWIVGYLSNDRSAAIGQSFGYTTKEDAAIDLSTTAHEDWIYYDLVKGFSEIESIDDAWFTFISYEPSVGISPAKWYKYKFSSNATSSWNSKSNGSTIAENLRLTPAQIRTLQSTETHTWYNFETIKNKIITDWGYPTVSQITDLYQYDGRKVLFSDGIYQIEIIGDGTESETANGDAIDYLETQMIDGCEDVLGIDVSGKRYTLGINYTVKNYKIKMTYITNVSTSTQYTYSIPTTANPLIDAPYTMFAIPYYINSESGTFGVFQGTTSSYTTLVNRCDPQLMFKWVQDIVKEAGSNLYDIQLLPYCPIKNYVGGTTATNDAMAFLVQNELTEGTDYTLLKNNNTNVGIMFFPKQSQFSFTLTNLARPGESSTYPDVEDFFPLEDNIKVQSETQVCRLVSPNYNGAFEFNIAKNGGVKRFNIDCTYKPYNPYIQVQPDFGRLYGSDFNDARGLICGGDFSLPIVTDAWTQYELQNKNYEKTFNRQIENMEVNNSVQRINEIASSITGTLAGGAAGGAAGAMTTGSLAAGATAGLATGIISGIGGLIDYNLNEKLRNEAIDYTKDQFGYQLGNIKALPYTLNKISSVNAVSKYVPFVEIYECTDVEKEALENKIRYNGMTVMTVGKMSDYLQPDYSYIKGQLIRLEDANLDTNEINAIASELSKGVYIK